METVIETLILCLAKVAFILKDRKGLYSRDARHLPKKNKIDSGK